MRDLVRWLLACLLAFGPGLAAAPWTSSWTRSLPQGRLAFHSYGFAQGLKNQSLWALEQDSEGFLWAGTENGLFRYEGAQFRGYGLADGLPSTWIRALLADGPQRLWIGTTQGLAVKDGHRIRPLLSPAGLPPGEVFSLAKDDQGRLWVAMDGGLFRQKSGDTFELAPGWKEGTLARWVWPDGSRMMVTSQTRLLCYVTSALAPPTEWIGPWTERLDAVVKDGQGRWWVRSRSGLWLQNQPGGAWEDLSSRAAPAAYDGHLRLTPSGSVLLPTVKGLVRIQGALWESLDEHRSLQAPRTNRALVDRDGTLWLGGHGLHRTLAREAWRQYTAHDGITGGLVRAILRGPQGQFWVGTAEGLVEARNGAWTSMTQTENQALLAMTVAPDGAVWIGGAPARLRRWVPGSSRMQEFPKPTSTITHMLFDAQGVLWVVTRREGLFAVQGQGDRWTVTPAELPHAARFERIQAMVRGSGRRLWVATNQGLVLQEDGRWRRFRMADGLSSDNLLSVFEDSQGDLWISFQDRPGLSRFSYQRDILRLRDEYGTVHGFGDRKIFFTREDALRRIWVGTSQGVDMRDAQGWHHFGSADGLPGDDCNGSAFWAEPDGDVWIGMLGGLARFDHHQYQGLPQPPASRILGVQVDGRWHPAPLAAPLVVPPGRAFVEPHFTAMTVMHETRVQHQVRLVGLDDTWQGLNVRQIRYARLNPGQYRFEVRAGYGPGRWGAADILAFRVLPAWYQSLWFRLLLVLSALGFLGLVIWWRIHALRARNRMLERLVTVRTRELQEAKEAAERASQFKSVFITTTSHELRTPLNAILGFLGLLDQPSLRATERSAYLRTIRGAAESLLQLVNDLLDLSRIEAGMLKLEPTTLDLRSVLEESVHLLAAKAREKGLLLLCEVPPEVPPWVIGDPHRLRQMVVNYLGNAVKFTESGQIRVKAQRLSEDGSQVRIRISVEDSGEGIPPEMLGRLFQAFTQAESKAKRMGTGLGLSITRHLAQRMNGQVGVESTVGKGSTFWFDVDLERSPEPAADVPPLPRRIRLGVGRAALRENLHHYFAALDCSMVQQAADLWVVDRAEAAPEDAPDVLWLRLDPSEPSPHPHWRVLDVPFGWPSFLQAFQAPPAPEPVASHPEPEPLQGRILVADDNESNRLLVGAMLRQIGLEHRIVRDGEEAVAAFQAESFDVVLLDRNMPGMDGFQAMKVIRQDPRGHSLPLVLFSASVAPEAIEEGLQAGFNDYLPKPADVHQIHAMLAKQLRGHQGPVPAAPSRDAAEIMDSDRLQRLAPLLGGPDGLAEFIQTFLEDGRDRLDRLHQNLDPLDRTLLERDAHDLKTNSGNLGLTRLSGASAALELAAREAPVPELQTRIQSLTQDFETATQRLNHYLHA